MAYAIYNITLLQAKTAVLSRFCRIFNVYVPLFAVKAVWFIKFLKIE